jgi:hypothetical protein
MKDDWRSATRLGLRLLTSHHPLCGHFASDRWMTGRQPWCTGCVVLWPTFVAGVVAAGLLLRQGVDPWALGASALMAGMPQATTYVRRWPLAMRVTAKAVGGFGLGAVVLVLLALPLAPLAKGLLVVGLVGGSVIGMALRLRSLLRTCRRCPWNADWEHCPGFEPDVSQARPGIDPDATHPWPGR